MAARSIRCRLPACAAWLTSIVAVDVSGGTEEPGASDPWNNLMTTISVMVIPSWVTS